MYTLVSTKELLVGRYRGRVEDPLPQRVFTHSKLRTAYSVPRQNVQTLTHCSIRKFPCQSDENLLGRTMTY